jgi:hypothetical protein
MVRPLDDTRTQAYTSRPIPTRKLAAQTIQRNRRPRTHRHSNVHAHRCTHKYMSHIRHTILHSNIDNTHTHVHTTCADARSNGKSFRRQAYLSSMILRRCTLCLYRMSMHTRACEHTQCMYMRAKAEALHVCLHINFRLQSKYLRTLMLKEQLQHVHAERLTPTRTCMHDDMDTA